MEDLTIKEKTFRAFLAIEIPESIKDLIASTIKLLQLDRKLQNIKWTKPDNWHITLSFLGNINQQQFLYIDQNIKSIIGSINGFQIQSGHYEPCLLSDRILSINFIPSGQLVILDQTIKNIVQSCDIPIDHRPFTPHVTIGRINDKKKINSEVLDKVTLSPISFEVFGIKLFKSETQGSGSIYTEIATYSFGKKL